MSDSKVLIGLDKIATQKITRGADDVHFQEIHLTDADGATRQKVTTSAPGASDAGAVVRIAAPGVAAADLCKAEDAVAASGDTGVAVLGVRNDAGASRTNTDGDYGTIALDAAGRVQARIQDGQDVAQGTTTDAAITSDSNGTAVGFLRGLVKMLADAWSDSLNALRVVVQAAPSGGATPYHRVSTADTNAASVKGTAGQVFAVWATNVNAAIRYLKFYDVSGTPNPASDAVKWVCGIPGNTAGAGGAIAFPPGLEFTTGIGIAIVTGAGDTDNTGVAASEILVSIAYK